MLEEQGGFQLPRPSFTSHGFPLGMRAPKIRGTPAHTPMWGPFLWSSSHGHTYTQGSVHTHTHTHTQTNSPGESKGAWTLEVTRGKEEGGWRQLGRGVCALSPGNMPGAVAWGSGETCQADGQGVPKMPKGCHRHPHSRDSPFLLSSLGWRCFNPAVS